MYTSTRMPVGTFTKGSLADGTPFVVKMANAPLPCSITLNSAAAGRLIELSTNGQNFFIPTVDTSTADMQVLVVEAPISHIRLTGQAGDTWSVL